MRRKPRLEVLEGRCLPSTLALVGSTVFDLNLAPGIHNLTAVSNPGGTLTFTNDAQSLTVPAASVTNAVFIDGLSGHSRIFQGVSNLPARIVSLGAYDVVNDLGVGGQNVSAYGAYSVIQCTGGNNKLGTLGYGAAVFGGTGDVDTLLGDRSLIYNIVGPATIRLGTHSKDYIFDNFASVTTGALPTDSRADFFAPGRTPGVFALTYDPVLQTVYATADQAGDKLQVFSTFATLTSPTSGTLTITYPSVRTVGAFGGNGTDQFFVFADADVAMYGQGGPNNVLFAAGGDVNVLKTGTAASISISNARFIQYATGAAAGQSPDTIVQAGTGRDIVVSNVADTLVGFTPGVSQFVGQTSAPTGPVVPLASDWVFALLNSERQMGAVLAV